MGLSRFLVGLAAAVRGVVRLASTPSLWGWAFLPVVVTFAFLVGLALVGYQALHDVVGRWSDALFGGSLATGIVFTVVYWALFLVIGFFVFSACVRLVSAPFLALLADRTVGVVAGRPAPAGPGNRFVRWVLRPIWEALVVLGIRLVVTIVTLPLLLIPLVGAALFTGVSAALFGLDLLDVALSARGVLLRPRMRFVLRNFAACLGLGLGATLLLLVPCVNVLLLPAVVVGAVLLDARISPDFPRVAAAPRTPAP